MPVELKQLVTVLSLLIFAGIILNFYINCRNEGFSAPFNYSPDPSNLHPHDPVDDTPFIKDKSGWDYYGKYEDYLFDRLARGENVDYLEGRGFYCDRPNRNRNWLVNPLLTQKHIFIKPNVNSFLGKYPYDPDWGNSALDIRIGSEVEFDPSEFIGSENIFYNNFSKIVNDYQKGGIDPRAYIDDYRYRCVAPPPSHEPEEPPEDTYTNPY